MTMIRNGTRRRLKARPGALFLDDAPPRTSPRRRQRTKPCPKHPGESLKFYCTFHNDVICCICAIKHHKTCSETLTIAETLERFKKEHENLHKALEFQEDTIEQALVEKEDEILILQKDTAGVKTEIEYLCKKLQSALNERKQEMFKVLSEMEQEQIRKQREVIDALQNIKMSTSKTKESAENSFHRKWPSSIISAVINVQKAYQDRKNAFEKVYNMEQIRCIEFLMSDATHTLLQDFPVLGSLIYGESLSNVGDLNTTQSEQVHQNGAPSKESMADFEVADLSLDFSMALREISEARNKDSGSLQGEDEDWISTENQAHIICAPDVNITETVEEKRYQSNFLPKSNIRNESPTVGSEWETIVDLDKEDVKTSGGTDCQPTNASDPAYKDKKQSDTDFKITTCIQTCGTLSQQDSLPSPDENDTDEIETTEDSTPTEITDIITETEESVQLNNLSTDDSTETKESVQLNNMSNENCQHCEPNDFKINIHKENEEDDYQTDVVIECEMKIDQNTPNRIDSLNQNFYISYPLDTMQEEINHIKIPEENENENYIYKKVSNENSENEQLNKEKDAHATTFVSERINVKEIKEFRTVKHATPCWLYGITVIPDGRLVITDVAHDSLQLYDTNLKFVNELKTDFTPWDVTATQDNLVAVCSGGKSSLYIFEITEQEFIHIKTVNVGMDAICVAFQNKHFIVGTRGGIVILNAEGKVVSKISESKKGLIKFRRADFVTVNEIKGDIYFVNTWSGKLFCIRPDGSLQYEYQNHKLCPRGIICHKEKLYAVSKAKGEIIFLDEAGHVDEGDKLEIADNIYAIAHHPDQNILALTVWDEKVCNDESRSVKVVYYR